MLEACRPAASKNSIGDEQVRLVAEDEPLYIPRGACPGGRERQHAEHDVRIGALGVRGA
jgi:hypothetical protein